MNQPPQQMTPGSTPTTEEPPTIPHGRGHNPLFVTFDDPVSFRPRLLSDHIVEAQDAALNIQVLDQPGHGNAHHVYQFYVEPNANNERGYKATIHFQNGPIVEHGINGITQEALLAVVADRLRSFQAGRFACRENGEALTHVEEAIHWLQQRTIQRRRRGVEGLSIV